MAQNRIDCSCFDDCLLSEECFAAFCGGFYDCVHSQSGCQFFQPSAEKKDSVGDCYPFDCCRVAFRNL